MILFFVGILIALSILNPSRSCGLGHTFIILVWQVIFYAIWAIFLLIEAYFLHRKAQKRKRNANIIMALALPTFLLLVSLFFGIKDLID